MTSMPQKFVIFDLETTGLDPHEDRIIEMGAIKVDKQ
jgi:DNA polymerase III epsilon subunit-like protein